MTSEKTIFLVLLSLVILSIFFFQNHKNGFEEVHHGYVSSHGMTLAKSLFQNNHLLMFTQRTMKDNGKIEYAVYNHVPFPSFFLIGLMIKPFEPDLASEIYVARQLMNLFFILSLIVGIKIINNLTRDLLLSLTIVLLSFSAYYLLYYNDMIFNDTPSLLGFVLSLFLVQQGQASQLKRGSIILLSILAISLGWQSVAVFSCWFLVDLFKVIFTNKTSLKKYVQIVRCPSFMALVVGIIWGLLLVGFQFTNEWITVGGSFKNIQGFQRVFWRLGLESSQTYAQFQELKWGSFILDQMKRMVIMATPFSGMININLDRAKQVMALFGCICFILVWSTVFINKFLNKTILIVFTLSGLFWAVPMRHFVAFHEYQSIYFIGFSISFFTAFGLLLKRESIKILSMVCCLLFIISVKNMNQLKEGAAPLVNPITKEFQEIYNQLPANSTVFIDGDRHRLGMAHHAVDFYLIKTFSASSVKADYVISDKLPHDLKQLTNNQHLNLFGKK